MSFKPSLAIVTVTSSLVPISDEVTGLVIACTAKSKSPLISAQNETHGLACLMANWF